MCSSLRGAQNLRDRALAQHEYDAVSFSTTSAAARSASPRWSKLNAEDYAGPVPSCCAGASSRAKDCALPTNARLCGGLATAKAEYRQCLGEAS